MGFLDESLGLGAYLGGHLAVLPWLAAFFILVMKKQIAKSVQKRMKPMMNKKTVEGACSGAAVVREASR
jgi:hypothetical protein